MPPTKKSTSNSSAPRRVNAPSIDGAERRKIKKPEPKAAKKVSPPGFLREKIEMLRDRSSQPPAAERKSGPRSINLYRRIALSFILLTILLLAVVCYFSFVKLTIVLIPSQERVSDNFTVNVYDKDKVKTGAIPAEAVAGIVRNVEIKEDKVFPSSGAEVIGEEVSGKVTIVNHYNKNQPLVATTRLLSPDNKLFRIKETVNVPAGGSVEAAIYADEPGADMAIGPTTFTIPGLWAGLQDKIYGESKEKFVYQEQTKKYVEQSDIDNAVKSLKKDLLARAEKEIGNDYKDYDQVIYSIDENTVDTAIDGQPGEEKDSFSVNVKTMVTIVAFPDEQISDLAREKISADIPDDKELMDFDQGAITYTLGGYNIDTGVATVKADFEGRTILSPDAQIVDPAKLVGLTRDQLEEYLNSFKEIAGYELDFSPAFISKVPNLVDRISVEIKR